MRLLEKNETVNELGKNDRLIKGGIKDERKKDETKSKDDRTIKKDREV